ncbi:MAG: hypothetical protein ACPG4Z_03935 [Chitinophagales bacterium]
MFSRKYYVLIFIALVSVSLFYSCKDDDPERPVVLEEITFQVPDSSTIIQAAGTPIDITLMLTTENAIDTLRAGYVIDTSGIYQNIAFAAIDTVVLTTGFDTESNIQQYTGQIMLPSDAYGVRPFRSYNPANTDTADVVRIVFRMEAGFDSYEKQLKVFIE